MIRAFAPSRVSPQFPPGWPTTNWSDVSAGCVVLVVDDVDVDDVVVVGASDVVVGASEVLELVVVGMGAVLDVVVGMGAVLDVVVEMGAVLDVVVVRASEVVDVVVSGPEVDVVVEATMVEVDVLLDVVVTGASVVVVVLASPGHCEKSIVQLPVHRSAPLGDD